jgi:hypothetical protein
LSSLKNESWEKARLTFAIYDRFDEEFNLPFDGDKAEEAAETLQRYFSSL